ncbi:MAG: AMP-binding protein [Hyphomicrobiales bacterium]
MLLHDLFLATAERMPEAPAFEFAGRTTSYGAAARQVRALAAALRRELAPGARIAIHMHKSEPTIIVMLASLAAGMTYVPIDPRYPAERRRFVMADAGVAALFVDARTARDWDFGAIDPERLMLLVSPDGARAGGLCREFALAELLAGDATSRTLENPAADIAADDSPHSLYLGLTGTPKGVMISHRNAAASLPGAARRSISAPAIASPSTPQLNFDLPVFDIYVGLANGATVMPIDEETVLYPQALMNFLKVGTSRCSMPYLRRSPHSSAAAPLPATDCRTSASFSMPARNTPARFPSSRPPCRRRGSSISTVRSRPTRRHLSGDQARAPRPAAHLPIGRPVHNAAVTLLDPDTGVAVETGSEGDRRCRRLRLARLSRPAGSHCRNPD